MKYSSLIIASFLFCIPTFAAEPNANVLPRSTPESQGVSSEGILDFVAAADREVQHMHSVMLLRHGNVVAEGWWAPYNAESRHEMFSLSKSFTSTAAGLAIEDGKFSLDDPVLSFFPDSAPAEPSDNLRAMKVRHLLSMSTGQDNQASRASELPWVEAFLAQPVPHEPGTHFMYNTMATYMVSAIVQKQTGQTVLDYLRPRLFSPLGIKDPTWGTSQQGITLGGFGLSVRTEDIARFGQLYLQRGKWNGQQLIPESWIEEATKEQVSNGDKPDSDWAQGYGFQFWRCRWDCFRGDGAYGQFCVVMPEQDAVLAITGGYGDMQAVLNLVWKHLRPAMKKESLSPDAAAHEKLKNKLAGLTMPVVEGAATSPVAKTVAGKNFVFSTNDQQIESVQLDVGGDGQTTLILHRDGVEQSVLCGSERWAPSARLALARFLDQPAAASGAWTADDTYTANLCFYETPQSLTLRLKFFGDTCTLEMSTQPGGNTSKVEPLTGKVEGKR